MTRSRQDQAAGENSQQLQAGGDIVIVNQGVSVSEVHAIIRAEIKRVEGELRATAVDVAQSRMQSFGDRLFHTLNERGHLDAFADPDFQFALNDANRAAASNDDEDTEALLVELLANRAAYGNTPRVRLVTKQALVAADKLTKDALTGLSAMWAFVHIGPVEEQRDPSQRIKTIRATLEPFVETGLPEGSLWLEDLDVLGLVRLEPEALRRLNPFADILLGKAPGVVHQGYPRAAVADILRSIGPPASLLDNVILTHPFDGEKVIIPAASKEQAQQQIDGTGIEMPRYPRITALLDKYVFDQDPEAHEAFTRSIDDDDVFAAYAKWWANLKVMNFTPVGDTVAFVHTKTVVSFGGAASVADLLELRDRRGKEGPV